VKTKELAKLLSEKGLTAEHIAKIVEQYEKQRERVKKYQKEKYYKVSISVKKEIVKKISSATGIPEDIVKKYLAALKIFLSLPETAKEKLHVAVKQFRE